MKLSKISRMTMLGLVLAFLGLSSCSYMPLDSYLNPVAVTVTDKGSYLALVPQEGEVSEVGFLFLPGGLVNPRSYIGSLAPLAKKGYRVIIAKMPFDLAVFDQAKANKLAGELGGRWVLGGHSLGGAMATYAIHDKPENWDGLVLMAAYGTKDKPITSWEKPVLSLLGSMDGLVSQDKLIETAGFIPPGTEYVTIEGGNHAQFGAYGPQDKDKPATITPEAQFEFMANSIDTFIQGKVLGNNLAQ